jgi:hypothetical protein
VVPPLEDSFELAWERAKIVAPEESPRLSRAAAGSIIAIALSVILGALAFNFRQDIGWIFISVGRKISGESRAADPLPAPELKAETKPETLTQIPTSDAPSSVQSSTRVPYKAPRKNPGAGSPPVTTPSGAARTRAGDRRTAPETKNSMAAGAQNMRLAKESRQRSAAGTGGTEPAAKAPVSSPSWQRTPNPRRPAAALEFCAAAIAAGFAQGCRSLWTNGASPEVTLVDLYCRGDGVERIASSPDFAGGRV